MAPNIDAINNIVAKILENMYIITALIKIAIDSTIVIKAKINIR